MISPEHFDTALKQLSNRSHQGYQQLAVPVEGPEPLGWLAQQTTAIRGYWHNKSGEQSAFVGSAQQLLGFDAFNDACQQLDPNNSDIRFYGGVAFSQLSARWSDFPHYRFLLPRFELRTQGQNQYFVINAYFEPRSQEDELAQIRADFNTLKPAKPLPKLCCQPLKRSDTPTFSRWQQLIDQVVAPEFQSHTTKVVLARRSRIHYQTPPNPFSLLAQWQQCETSAFTFLFQFDGERSFLGCSPERLYQRSGAQLRTEALAGTAPRGISPAEDLELGEALLNDHKSQVENQLVVDDLCCRLKSLSHRVSTSAERTLVKLGQVQHLCKTLTAAINPELQDPQLLLELHPTPAVGGTPRTSALHYIQRHEGFARGWYAGAVGCVSGRSSEFSVAIRSALIEPQHMDIFAGAGIVQGSDANAEWQELDNKIATLMSLIDHENHLC